MSPSTYVTNGNILHKAEELSDEPSLRDHKVGNDP